MISNNHSGQNTLFGGGAQKQVFQLAQHFANSFNRVWIGSDDLDSHKVVTEMEKVDISHVNFSFRKSYLSIPATITKII